MMVQYIYHLSFIWSLDWALTLLCSHVLTKYHIEIRLLKKKKNKYSHVITKCSVKVWIQKHKDDRQENVTVPNLGTCKKKTKLTFILLLENSVTSCPTDKSHHTD